MNAIDVLVGELSPKSTAPRPRRSPTKQAAQVASSLSALVICFLVAPVLEAQPSSLSVRFFITLERIGCLGSCPDYKVTILGNGSVQYIGRAYVRVDGFRTKTVPVKAVQKLVERLRDEDFFHWEEKEQVCLDFPEVHITVSLDGQQKRVLEGCNSPGKLLALASISTVPR
jgi:hypothetical protein